MTTDELFTTRQLVDTPCIKCHRRLSRCDQVRTGQPCCPNCRHPRRVQRRRAKGSQLPEGAISVARPSRYGNPFRIVATSVAGLAWHDLLEWDCGIGAIPTEETCYASLSNRYDAAEHAVGLYRRLLLERQHVWTPARFEKWIRDARSHDLACYCPPQQPCHAEPLLELANSIHSNADTGAKP